MFSVQVRLCSGIASEDPPVGGFAPYLKARIVRNLQQIGLADKLADFSADFGPQLPMQSMSCLGKVVGLNLDLAFGPI
jgi:hypothetical protein